MKKNRLIRSVSGAIGAVGGMSAINFLTVQTESMVVGFLLGALAAMGIAYGLEFILQRVFPKPKD